MNVQATVVLKLLDLVDAAADPELALGTIDELADTDVADLLDLYQSAQEESGHEPSVLIRSAIRRLRKQLRTPAAPAVEPNS